MSVFLIGVFFFLVAALLLYMLFGGADFGAGILELFRGKNQRSEQQKIISHAMAPVWEANHVWLVLVIVILFMGFPLVYSIISTHLFIPLIAILIGIIGRGCAFTFRHYDTLTSEYHRSFSTIFSLSSLWTSFFLGVTVAALTLGNINPQALGFHDSFIAPWFNWFAISTGLFTCCLFTFLAAVYLVGESQDEELRKIFLYRAKMANIFSVVSGAFVFLAAEWEGLPLIGLFLSHPVSLVCFASATVLLAPLWIALKHPDQTITVRVFGIGLVSLVLFGWFAVQYPLAIRMNSIDPNIGLTFIEAQSPQVTLKALFQALVIGSLLIFPALGYLFKIFKWNTLE